MAKKPAGISSNHFLSRLKRKYNEKKAGFSGTLDPFASGVLIVAFGGYTRLFSYLKKEPKIYKACIWLGATCDSLDNENITKVENIKPFNDEILMYQINKLQGEISYIPPKFSAKHINGQRAYELARKGVDFELQKAQMKVFSAKLVHYSHPFLVVELALSEGAYARSWAALLARNLNINATLSALERLSEGDFVYENERSLNPLNFLKIPQNHYLGEERDFEIGIKLKKENFKIKENGEYFIKFKEFFSIIELLDNEVKYKLNGVKYANFD